MTAVEFSTLSHAHMVDTAARLKGGGSEEDGQEFAWGIAEVICTGFGNEAVAVLKTVQLLTALGAEDNDDTARGLIPNPYFVVNGHGGLSPRTVKYLDRRGLKNLGSAALGAAGAIGSIVTQVDISGIAQHSNALGSTGAHIYQLRQLAKGYKQSETVTGWMDACIRAKVMKATVRGTSLVGASVPIAAVGMITGAATAIGKLGIKLTYGKLMARVAMEIHWRANVECKIARVFGGVKGPQGPASAIMFEIFKRRGITRLGGQYHTGDIIAEPAGWLALFDKLSLM